MVRRVNIDIPTETIADFCRRWKVTELGLFGSVLRDDYRASSDVDVLVQFDEDSEWSLGDFVEMQDELGAMVGRKVDLVEKQGLVNPFRRHSILTTRQVVYAV